MMTSLTYLQFEHAVFVRALSDTWQSIKERPWEEGGLAIIGLLILGYANGLTAMWAQAHQLFLFAIVPAIVLVAIKFLWYLHRARWKLYLEKEMQVAKAGDVNRFDPQPELAGLVRRVADLALDHSFRAPLPDGHPFLEASAKLENSDHYCWTNFELAQLRRDILHASGALGSFQGAGDREESEYWRAFLLGKSQELIDALMSGKSVPELEILFGQDDSYEFVVEGVYGRKRTVSVAVRNATKSPLTNCQLLLKDVDTRHNVGVEYSFTKQSFQLLPGTSQFIKLVSYQEGTGSVAGAKKIVLECDISSIWGGVGSPDYEVDADREHILTLEAVCYEVKGARVLCRVWVDGEGKLQVEKV